MEDVKPHKVVTFAEPLKFVDSQMTAQMNVELVSFLVGNPDTIASAIRSLRSLLGRENPPIIDVMNKGLIPVLVRCLKDNSNLELQFDAAWALTNVTAESTEPVKAVIEADAVPYLVFLIRSCATKVAEQAVWTLGELD